MEYGTYSSLAYSESSMSRSVALHQLLSAAIGSQLLPIASLSQSPASVLPHLAEAG